MKFVQRSVESSIHRKRFPSNLNHLTIKNTFDLSSGHLFVEKLAMGYRDLKDKKFLIITRDMKCTVPRPKTAKRGASAGHSLWKTMKKLLIVISQSK